MPLGDFRKGGVRITGANWKPKLPSECNYEKELEEILNNNDQLDRTIDLFLLDTKKSNVSRWK